MDEGADVVSNFLLERKQAGRGGKKSDNDDDGRPVSLAQAVADGATLDDSSAQPRFAVPRKQDDAKADVVDPNAPPRFVPKKRPPSDEDAATDGAAPQKLRPKPKKANTSLLSFGDDDV